MSENSGVPIEVTPTIEVQASVEMGGRSSEYNAEAWAVGERGGVPVVEGDQTYHNNSKWYAERTYDASLAYKEKNASDIYVVITDAIADPFRELKASITPTQTGSGTVWPGGGGKNLLPDGLMEDGQTYDKDGVKHRAQSASGNKIGKICKPVPVTAGESYTLSGYGFWPSNLDIGDDTVYTTLTFWGSLENGAPADYISGVNFYTKPYTFTAPAGAAYVVLSCARLTAEGMIEAGSTATAFAPFEKENPFLNRVKVTFQLFEQNQNNPTRTGDIPIPDSEQPFVGGEIRTGRGVAVIKRTFGHLQIADATLTGGTGGVYTITPSVAIKADSLSSLKCNLYNVVALADMASGDMCISIDESGAVPVFKLKNTAMSLAAIKAAGGVIVYEAATAVEGEPFNAPEILALEGYNKIAAVSGSMISAEYACGLISDKTGADAEAAKESAEDAAESESNAEAWAEGTRDGTPVDSDDPTYQNNAKYYAEQAGDEAENAEAWANGTRGGTAVGSTDPAYHKNAAYYRGLAQADANAAAQSLTDAQAAAGQAAGHEEAAEAAAETAAEKAQEAIDTVVAAQGPGIVYMTQDGEFFVLDDYEEEE